MVIYIMDTDGSALWRAIVFVVALYLPMETFEEVADLTPRSLLHYVLHMGYMSEISVCQ